MFWIIYFGLYAVAIIGFAVFFNRQDRRIERVLSRGTGDAP